MMDRRMTRDLDNYITGHYGEDQFRGDDYCDACGEQVANTECAHGILCDKCSKEIHGEHPCAEEHESQSSKHCDAGWMNDVRFGEGGDS